MSNDPMAAAQRLEQLLARENDALKNLDFLAAVGLLPAKEAALANLAKQSIVAPFPPALAEMGQRLGRLAAENQTLLERAIAVQTRILRIVAQAAKPPPAVTPYGAAGAIAPSRRAAAMALSTRV